MYCIHCGKEIADGSAFCSKCGRKQDATGEKVQTKKTKKSKKGIIKIIAVSAAAVFVVLVAGIAIDYVVNLVLYSNPKAPEKSYYISEQAPEDKNDKDGNSGKDNSSSKSDKTENSGSSGGSYSAPEKSGDSSSSLFKDDCWACSGSGDCQECGGDGRVVEWMGDQYIDVRCTSCIGGNCSWCNGSGKE